MSGGRIAQKHFGNVSISFACFLSCSDSESDNCSTIIRQEQNISKHRALVRFLLPIIVHISLPRSFFHMPYCTVVVSLYYLPSLQFPSCPTIFFCLERSPSFSIFVHWWIRQFNLERIPTLPFSALLNIQQVQLVC